MGPDIGVHAGGAGLHGEADQFEHALDEFAALDLLHAEFAEIVDGVADGGDLIGIAVDRLIGERLARVGLGGSRAGEHAEAEQNGCGLQNKLSPVHRSPPNGIDAVAGRVG